MQSPLTAFKKDLAESVKSWYNLDRRLHETNCESRDRLIFQEQQLEKHMQRVLARAGDYLCDTQRRAKNDGRAYHS